MLNGVMKTLSVLIGIVVLLNVFGPYEPVPLTPNLDTSRIGPNLDAYFAAREAEVPGITPGTEKRVVWAGARGAVTPWAVVYVHGFSASSEEIRPVPDRVAAGLGANLIFTRLKGHGRDGVALAEATVQDWNNDLAEALTAGRAVGDKVLVISTSTGGTLVAAAAQSDAMMERVAGAVFVSPNFGVNNSAAPLLTWPAARYWVPLIAGAEHSFEPANEAQARYWTTAYPSTAVFPMAALVKAVGALDHGRARLPALFYFSEDDRVVVPDRTLEVIAAWGGPVRLVNPVLGAGDDRFAHVIAGDILSPGQTGAAVREIVNWAKGLD